MTATEEGNSELDGENRNQVRYVLVMPPGLAELTEKAATAARMLPTEWVRSVVRDFLEEAGQDEGHDGDDESDDDDEPDDDDDEA